MPGSPVLAPMQAGRSMAGLIGRVRPHLGGALVDDAAFARIRGAARLFPPLSGAILECRLADAPPDADLSLRALAADGGRALLAGGGPGSPFPRALLEAPAWRRVRAFCRRWADPRSPLCERVETVWLEFDSPSLGDAVPVPSVFFSAPALNRARAGRVALGGVETLRGAPLSAGARRNLRRCMDALPAEAALTYLGVMLARPGDSVRFCATLPAVEVARYLAAVGWAHPTAPVERILGDVVRGFAPRVVLNLDVGETLLPTLGVEVKPEPEGLWPAFMERLVARGLCSPARAGAVLGWPGHDAALEGMRAGVDVSLAPPPGAPAAATALRIRTLNHAKLVVRPGCRPRAKVYLYAGFVWPRAAGGA